MFSHPTRTTLPSDGGGPPVRLQELDINVSNLCNLQCLHCSYASTPLRAEPTLPGDVIHRILDEAAALGNKTVHWSGGEPVIRPDMPELIAHGASIGFSMRLLSNGILLTPEKLEQLWNHGLRKIFVSLDGLEENHDFHRASRGLYAKTMRGIDNAVAAGLNVRVNAAATTRNVDEMPDLLALMAERGVHIFSVFYLIPVGRGRDIVDLQVPPERWQRLVGELRQATRALGPRRMEVAVEKVFWWDDEWNAEGLLDEGRGGGCLGFLKTCDYLNVLADGRVYPCVCFIDVAPPLGNVYERPLADLLHDPRGWTFYRSLTALNDTCRRCPMVRPCGGGSRANSRIRRDDWFALDPRCSGDPVAQRFIPVCFMLREELSQKIYSGFEEATAGRDPAAPRE